MDVNIFSAYVGVVAQLILIIFLAGIFAPLRGPLLACVLSLIITIQGVALVNSATMFFGINWQFFNFLLASVTLLLIAFPEKRQHSVNGLKQIGSSIASNLFPSLLILTLVLFTVLVAAVSPELSIDGQLYHGPILASIIESGTLWNWDAVNQYFYYTDLTASGGVNFATITGETLFDNGIQIPHLLIITLVIVWALGKRFKSLYLRLSLAFLIISAPVIWLQPRILYVDLAYGTAVAASILFIVFLDSPRGPEVLTLGISLGAVIASKPAGLLTGGALLLIALAVHLYRNFQTRTLSRSIVFLIIPSALGVSFYLRNFVAFSNPLYPVKIDFGPIHFPGIIDLSVFTSGNRGNGLLDVSRLYNFAHNLVHGSKFGVEKLDYDPREGGFGYVPLALLIIGIIGLISTYVFRSKDVHTNFTKNFGSVFIAQVSLVAITSVVLILQPSTFDSRYVIGPYIVIAVTVLITKISSSVPKFIELALGTLALVLALVQILWTETNMYPGLSLIKSLRTAQAVSQPSTPGNIWGKAENLAWLPNNSECLQISIQSQGGLTSSGMSEVSQLATLPYALYGEQLCNTVIPLIFNPSPEQINAEYSSSALTTNVFSSDFALVNNSSVDYWKSQFPQVADCFVAVQQLSGNDQYPESVTVFKNVCK